MALVIGGDWRLASSRSPVAALDGASSEGLNAKVIKMYRDSSNNNENRKQVTPISVWNGWQ
jgi:hypothetical protein